MIVLVGCMFGVALILRKEAADESSFLSLIDTYTRLFEETKSEAHGQNREYYISRFIKKVRAVVKDRI